MVTKFTDGCPSTSTCPAARALGQWHLQAAVSAAVQGRRRTSGMPQPLAVQADHGITLPDCPVPQCLLSE